MILLRTPAPLPSAELPADVRVMDAVATGIYLLAAVVLAASALAALARAPWFTIRAIQVEGQMERSSLPTLRANALPQLAGGFFTVDLAAARAAFESVPWVRRAVVRRVFPDRLAVRLIEHQAAALWQREDGNDRLVNRQGEVFDANIGDVEDQDLPRFLGPDGASAEMLSMHDRIEPVLRRLSLGIEALHLSGRGSWRVELHDGVEIELGRGSEDEIVERTERFARTLPEVTGRIGAPLLAADLRHADGYALRLRGVTTVDSSTSGKKDR